MHTKQNLPGMLAEESKELRERASSGDEEADFLSELLKLAQRSMEGLSRGFNGAQVSSVIFRLLVSDVLLCKW